MQLSKVTIEILQNLATINQGIIFKPGDNLRTMNVTKNTFVTATIPNVIPRDFAIYDLNEFLATYSLFDDCEVEFDEKKLTLRSGKERAFYFYSSPSVVVNPGDKSIVLPTKDKTFVLEKAVFDKIMRHSNVMKLKDIEIGPNGIKVFNRNSVGNQYNVDIQVECSSDNEPPSTLKVEHLKLIPTDYDVTISNQGIAHFKSKSETHIIEYFIALEGVE